MGVAAAGTTKQLETLAKGTAVFTAAAGAAGIASVGLAGTLGVGLGGAFALVGVKAALLNKDVAKHFKDLGGTIKNEIAATAAPVQKSMLQLVGYINTSLKTMRPILHGLFHDIAPLVTVFGQGLVQAVKAVVVDFRPLISQILPLARAFFTQLPDLIDSVAIGLHSIIDPLAGNTTAFKQLIQTIGDLLPIVGSILGTFVRLGQGIMPAFRQALLAVGSALQSGLGRVLPLVGKALNQMLPPLSRLVGVVFGALGKVLAAAIPVLGRFVSMLAGGLAKALPSLVPAFITLIGAINQLLPAVVPLIPPIAVLLKGVSNLIPPLAQLAAALIVALSPALTLVVKGVTFLASWLGDKLAKAVALVTPFLVAAAAWLGQHLGPAVAALLPYLDKVRQAVGDALVSAFRSIQPGLRSLWDGLKRLGPIVQVLLKVWVAWMFIMYTKVIPVLLRIAGPVLGLLFKAIGLLIGWVANVIRWVGLGIAAFMRWATGTKSTADAMRVAGALIVKTWNDTRNVIGAVVSFILRAIRGWLDAQISVVAGILHVMGKLPGPMGAPFRAAEDAVRKAKTTIDTTLDKIQGRVDALHGKHFDVLANAKINASPVVIREGVRVGLITGLARGGQVEGPGTETSDSVLARLSRGEFVVNARAAKALGYDVLEQVNAMRFAAGGPVDPLAVTSHRAERLSVNAATQVAIRAATKLAQAATQALAVVSGVSAPSSANRSTVLRVFASMFGWTSAAQRAATDSILMHESGYRNTAANPTSTAYGMFQFLNSTWAGVGGHKTSDPYLQAVYGGRYIAGRYGSPVGAWAFWARHHWYDQGGWLQPGLTLAYNGTGRPERVSPPGGGGVTVIVNIDHLLGGDPKRIANELTPAIRQSVRAAIRREGGNPGSI